VFEQFRRYAPIPELAGRRAAPPMDLAQPHALFGRKENKEPKNIFLFANTFFKKTSLAISYPAYRRELCPNA